MRFLPSFRIDLRRLILTLAFLSSAIALVNTLHASYRVQREQLIATTLEFNRIYAKKLAESTDKFLKEAQQQLAYSAAAIASSEFSTGQLLAEATRVQQQTDGFSSVLIVNQSARILAMSPIMPELEGKPLESIGNTVAHRVQRPTISSPFVSAAGNLLVHLSQPIFTVQGEYMGYVAGTIHLTGQTVLHGLLGNHDYRDGSYLYVVDSEGHVLYHQDASRVGERVVGNPAIEAVKRGETGSQRLINTKGEDMLAGYAPVPRSGWGVIAQRPTTSTLSSLYRLTTDVLRNTIPLALLSLFGIWWCAALISKPLWQLATNVEKKDAAVAMQRVTAIKAWYYEVEHLKQAVLTGFSYLQEKIGSLNLESMTDPMTGLQNRRGLQSTLNQWKNANQAFSILALDIDRFKRVNDVYGHGVGDEVIKRLAQLMRECSRGSDLLCRNGGEEFLMLLPGIGIEEATRVAQRLRQHVEATEISPVGHITISIGVAHWPLSADSQEQALEHADAAMYCAKDQGRNCVRVHSVNAMA